MKNNNLTLIARGRIFTVETVMANRHYWSVITPKLPATGRRFEK